MILSESCGWHQYVAIECDTIRKLWITPVCCHRVCDTIRKLGMTPVCCHRVWYYQKAVDDTSMLPQSVVLSESWGWHQCIAIEYGTIRKLGMTPMCCHRVWHCQCEWHQYIAIECDTVRKLWVSPVCCQRVWYHRMMSSVVPKNTGRHSSVLFKMVSMRSVKPICVS